MSIFSGEPPQPFYGPFPGPPGKPVPEENFWTLWCKGRLREADTPTIRLGATPSGLTSAVSTSTIPPFFTGRMLFLTNSVKALKANNFSGEMQMITGRDRTL